MRARLLLPCLLMALAAPCLATDPPAPAQPKSVVILPVAPKPDIPKPDTPVIPPLPDNIVKLVDDQVYDIVIKGPVAWRWHPAGVVSVTVKEVPAGRDFEKEANFWDGKKTKVYQGPCTISFIKSATPGGEPKTTDLDIIPIGLTDEKQITSLAITVNAQNPIPPPKPKPKPEPPKPEPEPQPDAALVASFKTALDKDIKANNGSKAKATDLAVVFDSGASLLDLGDPAIAPKTVGDLYSKMFAASVAKGVPRLPYLKETRKVIDANTPTLNGTTELTDELKKEFQAKYRAIAAALTEASK